jgi:glycogen operon protein
MALHPRTQPGRSSPLGSTVSPEGVNFSVFSKGSTQVELLLFDRVDDGKPSVVIPLDSLKHRTYHYWHVFVPGLQAGQIYGYRTFGPCEPHRGLRFDAGKACSTRTRRRWPCRTATAASARLSRVTIADCDEERSLI